jgi:hypothetical protein
MSSLQSDFDRRRRGPVLIAAGNASAQMHSCSKPGPDILKGRSGLRIRWHFFECSNDPASLRGYPIARLVESLESSKLFNVANHRKHQPLAWMRN